MHSDGQTSSQSSPFLFSSRQPQTKVKIENTNVEPIDLSAHGRPWQQVAKAGCAEGLPAFPVLPEEGTAGLSRHES